MTGECIKFLIDSFLYMKIRESLIRRRVTYRAMKVVGDGVQEQIYVVADIKIGVNRKINMIINESVEDGTY